MPSANIYTWSHAMCQFVHTELCQSAKCQVLNADCQVLSADCRVVTRDKMGVMYCEVESSFILSRIIG